MRVRRLSASQPGTQNRGARRGVATVELAFVMPLLTLLIFGVLEFGLLAKNSQSLNHVAREAVRVATTGATVAQIRSHIVDTSPALKVSNLTSTAEYRMWDPDTGTWGEWTTLTDNGLSNIASTGDGR